MSRPWYTSPEEPHGSEEIVGPGGPIQIGITAVRFLDLAKIAHALAPLCESPIETMLGAELVLQLADTDVRSVPQYCWLKYRMDFALVCERPLVFIECDGREFHSTPQQIENDHRKDKAAKAAGIPLLRFTGSEIFNDARACAELAINRIP